MWKDKCIELGTEGWGHHKVMVTRKEAGMGMGKNKAAR
jgi:hypothetical protein